MSDLALLIDEIEEAGPAADALAPDQVLVRVLAIPTGSARQARAAALLRLDELSPSPPAEVVIDVTRLDAGAAMSARWAIAIARRSEVARASARAQSDLFVTKEVEGREVQFRFKGPNAHWSLPAQCVPWVIPAAAAVTALALLLGAMVLRVERSMASEGIGDGAARVLAEQRWRVAADRDVSVRTWLNAKTGAAGEAALCAASVVTGDGQSQRYRVASIDSGSGAATVVVAGSVDSALADRSGVTVVSDGDHGERRVVRVERSACGEGTR